MYFHPDLGQEPAPAVPESIVTRETLFVTICSPGNERIMNMPGMSMPMPTGIGMPPMMVPYLHMTGGDNLFFKSVHPSSNGAIAGACICLILLSVLERFMHAARRRLEGYWRSRALVLTLAHERHEPDKSDDASDSSCSGEGKVNYRQRTSPAFILAHDIPRGVVQMFQSTLHYALMLAVMTFNAAYVLSIIMGLGVGEMLFGRIGMRG